MTTDEIATFKESLRKKREEQAANQPKITPPIYDDVYFEAMEIMDSYEFWSES